MKSRLGIWGTAALLSAGLVGAALYGPRVEAQEKRPTAREVVAAIQEHIGVSVDEQDGGYV